MTDAATQPLLPVSACLASLGNIEKLDGSDFARLIPALRMLARDIEDAGMDLAEAACALESAGKPLLAGDAAAMAGDILATLRKLMAG